MKRDCPIEVGATTWAYFRDSGGEAQERSVGQQLDQQGAVTITGIHGMGGIGKTALAVHVAHQLIKEGRFPDAQLYIDLRGAGTSPVDPLDALDRLLNAILEPDRELCSRRVVRQHRHLRQVTTAVLSQVCSALHP